jgi:cytochrome c
MNKLFFPALVAGALVCAPAVASEDLNKAKGCRACHAMDKKMMGPSYKEIAKKYDGQKDAEAHLVTVIMKGGRGVWGGPPMPANPSISKEDATKLAQWILAMK